MRLLTARYNWRWWVKAFDALHIACAEQGKADVLLTTDDLLVAAVKRNQHVIAVKCNNPVGWFAEVSADEG